MATSENVMHNMSEEVYDTAHVTDGTHDRIWLYIIFGFIGVLMIFTLVFGILVGLNKIQLNFN